jgi:hypothetical protein
MEDDGADLGIIVVAVAANLERQFEFLKTEWVNQGLFSAPPTKTHPFLFGAAPSNGSDA